MPGAGDYLFGNASFGLDDKPFLSLQQGDAFYEFSPIDYILTLQFDTSQRYCTGWRDIAAHTRHHCPDANTVDSKYEECAACQKRTGFNPAFYHAASVSAQQESRNSEPHFLYLAHFGPGVVKVGISYAGRKNSRLLEQGARSALVLGTFPTAHIARSYEAKIAALPGVAETVQLRQKLTLLPNAYDAVAAKKELLQHKHTIEEKLGTPFGGNTVMSLDSHYHPSGVPLLADTFDATPHDLVSGKVTGMQGTLLFCHQQDTPVFLPLKKYVGYKVKLSHSETAIPLPARQISLF